MNLLGWDKLLFCTALLGLVQTVVAFNVEPPFIPPSNITNVPRYSLHQLYALQKKFYDAFVYPANLKQAQSINSTVLAPNVQGRVDATRTFNGAELNTEYLFGLFTDPSHISLIGTPISYEIVQFVGNDNIASATVIAMFNISTFHTVVPVTIDTFMTWDENGLITQYDATFRWFEFLLDTLLGQVAATLNGTEAQAVAFISNLLANNICQTHQTFCTGANQQYANISDCQNFLLHDIRFGQAYELGRNTLLCRSVHEPMVHYRPSVHCPHIGPSGGGMCVDDQTYVQKVLQNYFTNSPFIPPSLTAHGGHY